MLNEAATLRGQELRMGRNIAEVRLEPDRGFDVEDLDGPDQHLSVWGDPDQFVAAVCRIYPADAETS